MMRALTICQPFADLIMLPIDDPRAKRVENRPWGTSVRGPLLIHAGKSRKYLTDYNYGIPLEDMTFGAILGVVDLVDCFSIQDSQEAFERRRWLADHQHVEGENCLVFERLVRKFKEPIPWTGKQGFFGVPDHIVRDAIREAELR